jgi:hypothetical protein
VTYYIDSCSGKWASTWPSRHLDLTFEYGFDFDDVNVYTLVGTVRFRVPAWRFPLRPGEAGRLGAARSRTSLRALRQMVPRIAAVGEVPTRFAGILLSSM